MKQYTTRFLKSVAVLYLSFPLSYIVLAAVLFDISPEQCIRILLSPLYYAVTLTAVLAGYGLWEMKRWSWYLFVASSFLIAYNNALLVNDYGETHHKAVSYFASLFLIASILYRVGKEVRVPYFFPRIRWWESNPRYKLSVPVTIAPATAASPLSGEILDVSIRGCFIKLRHDVAQDELLSLTFTVFGFPIECKGNVVWRTQSTVTHPKGVGVKFAGLGKREKRNLRAITHRLRKVAVLYRKSRYLMVQDEFVKRLEALEGKNVDTWNRDTTSGTKT